ncbi:MAG: ATP-binding cassette domain-containing protein [Alphaproteobacteria bacterium]|nr:ATP-binding cassette domain-containing protein [Alphaproteobacteria bacterium]
MAEPPLLSLRGVRVGFGAAPLFADVDLQLSRRDRACLVGRNGSGKSTLLKLIAGEIEADDGERFVQPGIRIAHLHQDPVFDPDESVAAFVAAGRHPRHAVDAMLAAVTLDGGRRMGSLSGGEGRRAAIARALVGEPDVLLLDEPTNHLDLAAIEWLERRLRAETAAVLTVSHDRTFLANSTGRICWLDRSRLRQHERGFAAFEAWSEAVLEAEAKELERLNVKIAEETRWLLRGITARRRRNQGRLRKLAEMRASRAALLAERGAVGKLEAEDGKVKSRLVIEAQSLSKAFAQGDDGELAIVRDFSTRILRGDRIGVIGPNGAGKTTLLRLLVGELKPDAGKVRVGKALRVAYFDQRREQLDPKETPWRTLCPQGGDSVMVQGRQRHVVGYLKDFLFTAEQAKSPIATLSGGERNRLLLAMILAQPADLLVLDEPTNDLDMDTLDLLQEMLADYGGTLLIVSHDRDFLDRTVSSTIAVEGGGEVVEYAGGYQDYLAQRKTAARPAAAPAKREGERRPAAARRRAATKLGYKDQRELDALPERMAALSGEIDRLEATLADPELYRRTPETFERNAAALQEKRHALAEAEERWLELEEKREALADGTRGS